MSGKIEFTASSLKRLEAGGTVDAERPAMDRSTSRAGRVTTPRSLRQISAPDGVSAPEVQLSHHG